MMVDRINDIAWQAQQGSVAAIIQLLNENLAHFGVRTRAVFSHGVLQLLCEAQTVEQLSKNSLIQEVRQILQSIAPRHINRVNINARIAREEQLLWLDEISNDPEGQLLWSEEIELKKTNVFQKLFRAFNKRKSDIEVSNLSYIQSSYQQGISNSSNQGEKAGWSWKRTSFSLGLLLLLGGTGYFFLGDKFKHHISGETFKYFTTTIQSLDKNNHPITTENSPIAEEDHFTVAVRIANTTAEQGKMAKTATQWLELAASWERASYLMGLVPTNHSRYQEAQIRTKLYKKYSEAAQKEADKSEL